MTVIDLDLVPLPATPGRYKVMVGWAELCRSRQPLLDAARLLLAEGYPPEAVLETRHQGSDIVAQRSTIGEAAKWTVSERDRGGLRRELWKPHPRSAQDADCSEGGAPGIERKAGEGTRTAPEPAPAFSGAPRHPSDDFAPHAKRARG